MIRKPLWLLPLLPLALAGCETMRPSPVEVTRFHLSGPVERGSLAIGPAPGTNGQGLEFAAYANAVSAELQRIGYVPVQGVDQSLYVAVIGYRQRTEEGPPRSSPVSIGIGGGTGGWRSGVGGGVSFGVGGGRGGVVLVTQLNVELKRRSDQTVVWEGHSVGAVPVGAPAAQADAIAARLAQAMFRDFPGESGRTISVP